ncbi:hypothetical protein ED733_002721 [Metarhizium rileyi]|uniref:Uncharacterized protein n=1 Tax=Metarhizium rileyi (strain RCEF 4871) TaxID=1649241 RepID=A0A5C6FZR8_METRR|nr:hypothetical protein ED733_002721 [Metarhizium rileyi]
MYTTPEMRRAASQIHSRDLADCELEPQRVPCTPGPVHPPILADMDRDVAAPSRGAVYELQVRMLVTPEDGKARCVTRTIDSRRQQQDIVLRLQGVENGRYAFITLLFSAFSDLFFMRHKTVWAAEVSLPGAAPEADVEDQEHGSRLVAIRRESFHPELTGAVRDNMYLKDVRYVEDRLPGIIVSDNLPWPRHERRGALYVKNKFSKARATIWSCCALIGSVSAGLAPGICTNNAGTGIEVGGATFARIT